MKKLVPTDAVLIPDQAKCVFEGKIFDVYQWQQTLFDGSHSTFEMLRRPDTVVVMAVVDDKVVVINDKQPNSGARLSFCGGRVDETDESVIAAAQREAREETGYEFANWRLIKVYQPHTKLEWFVYVLIARDVTNQQPIHLDAGEKIAVELLPLQEVRQLSLDKAGYLGEAEDILKPLQNIQELLALPDFEGKEVDR